MHRLLRATVIVLIALAAVWFGLRYGPAPSVRADIYMNLASSRGPLPDVADQDGGERNGVTLLNSNRLYYRISHTRKSVHRVLNDYQQSITPKSFRLFRQDKLPKVTDVARIAPELPFLEALMNNKRIVREESSRWGLVSFIDMGLDANEDWHAAFRRKVEAFARSGRLGDLGVARSVVAVANVASDSTTVISSWTDPDFNLRDFQDRGEGDLPGRDIDGMPRIQPTRRLLTFDQKEDRFSFMLVMYETPLTPDQALAAYSREAQRQGWTSTEQDRAERKDRTVLFLNRNDAEVQLFARRQGNKTIVLVNYQTTTGTERPK